MSLLLQLLILDAVTAYLLLWGEEMRRRSSWSWEKLVSQMQIDAHAGVFGDPVIAIRELASDACPIWQYAPSFRGLKMAFHNAGVVLSIVDFAEKYGLIGQNETDRLAVKSLRQHAMRIRIAIVSDLAKLITGKSPNSIYIISR